MKLDEKTTVLDATDQVLGRLAVRAAVILRGKHRPDFYPHRLSGDKVVITNAEKIRVSGRKPILKKSYRHTGWPGGLRSQALKDRLKEKPEQVIAEAVKGMLPKNRLTKEWMKRLTVTRGERENGKKETVNRPATSGSRVTDHGSPGNGVSHGR